MTVRLLIPLGRPRATRLQRVEADLEECAFVAGAGGGWMLEGVLECRAAYVGTDGAVRVRSRRAAFRQGVPGWEGRGGEALTARVSGVDYQMVCRPGRPFGDAVDVRVHLDAAPVPPAPAGGGEGAAAPAEAEPSVRFTPLEVEERVAERAEEVLEEMEVLLDLAAFKVIDVQCRVADLTARALAGAVLLEGRLFEQIYYVAEDGLIHYQHAEQPFQRSLEVPADPGVNAHGQASVRSLEHELTRDGRLLLQKICLRLGVRVTRSVDLEVVTDLPARPGMDVERDLVRVDQVIGAAFTRTLEKGTARLPVPATAVVKVVAAVEDLRPQVLHGQVLVEGVVREQIFYASGGTSFHQEAEIPFSIVLDVAGAEPGMQAQGEGRVEEASARLGPDGREVEREILLGVRVRVTDPRTLRLVTAVSGPGLEVAERRLKVDRLVGSTRVQMMLQKKVTLVSRALGIARVVGSVQDLQCEVIPDQVIVQGRFHQQVFFVDRQKIERHQTEDLPFTHLVDLPGALPGMAAEVQPRVKHLSHALAPEGNAFAEKIVVDLEVRVAEAVDLSVVTGVRLPGASGAAAATDAGGGAGGGDLVRCRGYLALPRPAAAVHEVRPALCRGDGDGRFRLLRVHAFYSARNRVVYHAEEDHPLPGDRPVASLREFRWQPASPSDGGCEGIRWEAVLQCSGSRST